MLRKTLAAWILSAAALAAQVVEGRVVNTATGNGIPDVAVRLFTLGQTAYTATTDATGGFRIEAVKDGSYTAFYNVPNFRPARLGASQQFQVTAGAGPVHLQSEMAPVSRISGRVLDGAGNPVPNATLQLIQSEQFGGSVWVFNANQKGEYSTPDSMSGGAWTLSATAPSTWKPPEPRDGQRFGWARTFYPGVTDPELAVKIEIPMGGEIPKLDIKLAAAPVYRVRGVLLDVHGDPVPKASVLGMWGQGGADGMGGALGPPGFHQTTDGDGVFEFDSVVDGEFRLSIALDRDGTTQQATQTVEVKGRDLENVKLQLALPFSIQGKVVMEVPEGATAPKAPQVLATSMPGGSSFLQGNPDGKGDFTIKNLYPGTYKIDPGVAPALYYLDSLRFGNMDVPESGVQILSGGQPLIVTYKRNGGSVRGTIEDCAAGTVFLVPQDPALRRDGFISRTRCDQNDRFEILAVRPGEYYGIAVAPDSPVRVSPMNLDQNLINQAARVSVRSNEATEAEIRLVKR
jgi:hypothetical protein